MEGCQAPRCSSCRHIRPQTARRSTCTWRVALSWASSVCASGERVGCETQARRLGAKGCSFEALFILSCARDACIPGPRWHPLRRSGGRFFALRVLHAVEWVGQLVRARVLSWAAVVLRRDLAICYSGGMGAGVSFGAPLHEGSQPWHPRCLFSPRRSDGRCRATCSRSSCQKVPRQGAGACRRGGGCESGCPDVSDRGIGRNAISKFAWPRASRAGARTTEKACPNQSARKLSRR